MSEMKTQRLTDAVTLHTFTDSRFKTMRVSVNMLLPLRQETAARNAILPPLASRATRAYPDYTALNSRLAQLYGACLSTSVRKMGAFQALTLSASGLSNRYAFGGEDMFSQLTGLLFDVLFDPLRDSQGLFPEEGFRQEQRQLLEAMDAEFNDKIAYAHRRCEEFLFQGQPAGVGRCGSRQDVQALDRAAVTAGWQEVLKTARFELFALGDCQPDPALFQERFGGWGQPQPTGLLAYSDPGQPRRLVEEQPLAQSKLSMAFRADYTPEESLLFSLMAAVLGGVPSSKLFQNVREKMGLCYYCSAGFSNTSRALFIESGVETENLARAEEAINGQLAALQRGELTEDELLSAKLALCNSVRSSEDSLTATESSCLGQSFSGRLRTPQETIGRLMAFTRDQVVEAAARLRPAAVYILKGSGVHGES